MSSISKQPEDHGQRTFRHDSLDMSELRMSAVLTCTYLHNEGRVTRSHIPIRLTIILHRSTAFFACFGQIRPTSTAINLGREMGLMSCGKLGSDFGEPPGANDSLYSEAALPPEMGQGIEEQPSPLGDYALCMRSGVSQRNQYQ